MHHGGMKLHYVQSRRIWKFTGTISSYFVIDHLAGAKISLTFNSVFPIV